MIALGLGMTGKSNVQYRTRHSGSGHWRMNFDTSYTVSLNKGNHLARGIFWASGCSTHTSFSRKEPP
jgi:hypothetical protein